MARSGSAAGRRKAGKEGQQTDRQRRAAGPPPAAAAASRGPAATSAAASSAAGTQEGQRRQQRTRSRSRAEARAASVASQAEDVLEQKGEGPGVSEQHHAQQHRTQEQGVVVPAPALAPERAQHAGPQGRQRRGGNKRQSAPPLSDITNRANPSPASGMPTADPPPSTLRPPKAARRHGPGPTGPSTVALESSSLPAAGACPAPQPSHTSPEDGAWSLTLPQSQASTQSQHHACHHAGDPSPGAGPSGGDAASVTAPGNGRSRKAHPAQPGSAQGQHLPPRPRAGSGGTRHYQDSSGETLAAPPAATVAAPTVLSGGDAAEGMDSVSKAAPGRLLNALASDPRSNGPPVVGVPRGTSLSSGTHSAWGEEEEVKEEAVDLPGLGVGVSPSEAPWGVVASGHSLNRSHSAAQDPMFSWQGRHPPYLVPAGQHSLGPPHDRAEGSRGTAWPSLAQPTSSLEAQQRQHHLRHELGRHHWLQQPHQQQQQQQERHQGRGQVVQFVQ